MADDAPVHEEIWDRAGPVTLAGLRLLSLAYRLGWRGYEAVYRLGLKRPHEPHQPVICVGNLLVGGTGKSPVVAHLARVLDDLGWPVVISASGYGSPGAAAASLAPDGALNPAEWGDEPALLRDLLPGVPLIVGRRRVLAAELAHEHFPDRVLLLDDGYQHLPLKKHLSILLDPVEAANAWCLPAGPYRQPRADRDRADLLLPGAFAVQTHRRDLRQVHGQARAPERLHALTAIGRPQRFFQSLAEWGVQFTGPTVFPDHHQLTTGNLLSHIKPEENLVVTHKDWVKLRQRTDLGLRSVWVLEIDVTIEPQDRFREWLQQRLAAITA